MDIEGQKINNTANMRKIGIFDSGFGGLSILKEIVKKLPEYEYVYLGDTARAPYGTRDQKTIYEFTCQGIDFLFAQGAELIILACNTASSEALRKIQQEYVPQKYPEKTFGHVKKVLGVIIPTAEYAVTVTKNKHIGVLATEATVRSGSFEREIQKLDPSIIVSSLAAPLLVSIIEEGKHSTEIAEQAVKKYVSEIFTNTQNGKRVDTLILGCTHYELIKSLIEKFVGLDVQVLCEGSIVAEKLDQYIKKHTELHLFFAQDIDTKVCFFTTGLEEKFNTLGQVFFGKPVCCKTIRLS